MRLCGYYGILRNFETTETAGTTETTETTESFIYTQFRCRLFRLFFLTEK